MPARASWAWRSQYASLLACQTPLKLGLPSAVRAARAAWPVAPVIDNESTAPAAADTTATAIVLLNRYAITSSPEDSAIRNQQFAIYCSASTPPSLPQSVAVSLVAGSGPLPAANARSSSRVPSIIVGRP